MSLSIRNKLAGTHPYLGWAIEYILTFAAGNGGRFTITSVNRLAKKQWDLFNRPNSNAVQVGCSQHQYGAAVDVQFLTGAWQEWFLASARNFGLSTVLGDPVHVQLIPGARFREWSASHGLCPDRSYPTVRDLHGFQELSFSIPPPGVRNVTGSLFTPVVWPKIFE